MEETYIKVKAKWVYLYRTVDKEGNTVDFMLSEHHDKPAAREFFKKTIGSSGIPDKITMDKRGANKAGIDTINLQLALLFMMGGVFLQINVRQVKYLNNILEQDQHFIKKITKQMQHCQVLNCSICLKKASIPNQIIQLVSNSSMDLQHKLAHNNFVFRLKFFSTKPNQKPQALISNIHLPQAVALLKQEDLPNTHSDCVP